MKRIMNETYTISMWYAAMPGNFIIKLRGLIINSYGGGYALAFLLSTANYISLTLTIL